MQPNQPLGRLNALLGAHGASGTPQPIMTDAQLHSTGSASTGIGSTLGGIIGSIGGTALAPGLGTIAGGGAGSALGDALEQALTHNGSVDWGNVGKEGAIGLASGAAGKALGAGVKAVKAARGATAAADAGNALTRAGDNLAIRGLRPTPTQLTNYAKTHGEDIAQTVATHGLQGADAKGIAKVISPLQQAFDNMATNSSVSVSKADLKNLVAQKLQPYLASGVGDDQTMGQHLQSEAEGLLKSFKGKNVSAADLNSARQRYDQLTKSFAGDPFMASKNRSMGTILREAVQSAADKAGLTDESGRSLKQTGRELSKLYDLQGIADKQANLGRGSLPLGMTTLLGGGLAGPHGVAGAVAGGAVTKAVNNPAVIGAAAKGLTKAGNAAGAVGQALGGASSQLAGHGLAGALQGLGQPPQAQMTPQPAQSATPGLSSALAASQPQSDPNDPFSQDNLQKLAMNDIQRTGGKNLSNILALQKLSSTPGAAKPVSSATNQQIANASSGLQQIQQLKQMLGSNPNLPNTNAAASVLPGALGNFARGAAGTQSFEASRNELTDVLARLRTGAAITKEEETQYKNLLPTAGDSPATIQQKLGIYEQLFAGILQRSQGGGDSPDLASALAGLQ